MKETNPLFLCLLFCSWPHNLDTSYGPKIFQKCRRKFSSTNLWSIKITSQKYKVKDANQKNIGERRQYINSSSWGQTYKLVVCGSSSSNDPSLLVGSKSSGSSSKRLEGWRQNDFKYKMQDISLQNIVQKTMMTKTRKINILYHKKRTWISSYQAIPTNIIPKTSASYYTQMTQVEGLLNIASTW